MIYWPKLHCQCWVKLCLIFQPLYYILKSLGDTEKVMSWKPKDFLTKNLTTFTTIDSISPSIKWYEESNFCLIFKGSCLKQKNATFTPPNGIII